MERRQPLAGTEEDVDYLTDTVGEGAFDVQRRRLAARASEVSDWLAMGRRSRGAGCLTTAGRRLNAAPGAKHTGDGEYLTQAAFGVRPEQTSKLARSRLPAGTTRASMLMSRLGRPCASDDHHDSPARN